MYTKKDSMAIKILEILALVGEVSADEILGFFKSKSYAAKVITNLKNDGFIKRSKDQKRITYRLSLAGKKKLRAYLPEVFERLLSDRKSMNVVREDNGYKQRRKKLYEVLSLFQGADVKIFPDEKVLLRKHFVKAGADCTDDTDCTDISDNITPEFYTSVEIKEFIPDFNIAKGSRSLGVLISCGTIYIVYSTSEGELLWRKETEIKFAECARSTLAYTLFGTTTKVKLLVLGDKEFVAAKIIKRYSQKSCGKIYPSSELPEMIFALKDSSKDFTLQIITKYYNILDIPKERITKEVKYDGIFPFLEGRSLSDSSLYYTQLLLLDLYKAAASIDACRKKGLELMIYCFRYQYKIIESMLEDEFKDRIHFEVFDLDWGDDCDKED